MARDHARTNLAIWADDDFRELSPQAQHLYFVLSTDPALSYCGVADWRPARIASKANGWTPAAVNAAGAELAEGLFLVVDENTEEALLRSFIKHDELMKNPRLAVAMMTAHAAVASKHLRAVIVFEVAKLRANQPDLACWSSKYSGEKLEKMIARGGVDAATFPTGFPRAEGLSAVPFTLADSQIKGSVYPKSAPVYPSVTPTVYPPVYGSVTTAPTPATTTGTSNEVPSALTDAAASGADAGASAARAVDEDGHQYEATTLDDLPAEEPPAKPKRKRKPEERRPDVEELCTRLHALIVANGNRTNAYDDSWRREARLLLDDGVPLEEALAVAEWCQQTERDAFWATLVLNMKKFREHYNTMHAQHRGRRRPQPRMSRDAQNEEFLRRSLAEAEARESMLGFDLPDVKQIGA